MPIADGAGTEVPHGNVVLRVDRAALFADAGADGIDFKAHVDAVRDGLLQGVLGYQVLLEKSESVRGGRSREPDKVSVEIVQDLPPDAIDGAVALVGDDEVEMLDGQRWIVGDRVQLPVVGCPSLEGGRFFFRLVEFAALQHGIQTLNRGEDDFGVRGDTIASQLLHDVGFVEFASGTGWIVLLVSCLSARHGALPGYGRQRRIGSVPAGRGDRRNTFQPRSIHSGRGAGLTNAPDAPGA